MDCYCCSAGATVVATGVRVSGTAAIDAVSDILRLWYN